MSRFLKISVMLVILLLLNSITVKNEIQPFQHKVKKEPEPVVVKESFCGPSLDATVIALQKFAKDKENRVIQKEKLCRIVKAVAEEAEKYLIDEKIILSMIWQESKFEERAVSSHGAMGLMQIMPNTARIYTNNLNDLYQPDKNIKIGVTYLQYLIEKYQNIDTAIVAYNQGEGNVSRGTYNTHYRDLVYKHYNSLIRY